MKVASRSLAWIPLVSLATLVSLHGCSSADEPGDTEHNHQHSTEVDTSSKSTPSPSGTKDLSNADTTTTPTSSAPSDSDPSDSDSAVTSSSSTPSTNSTTLSSTTATNSSNSTTSTGITNGCGPKIEISAVFRDFSVRTENGNPKHPDFQQFSGSGETTGLVQNTLNSDGKPVAVEPVNDKQLTSAESFAQWYVDDNPATEAERVSYTFHRTIEFVETSPGLYEYDSTDFYPIGPTEGWGKQQFNNNYGFTTEITLEFQYKAQQNFTFRGDDDLWLFIDGKLALDIGGLHSPVEKTLDLDVVGPQLGLVLDRVYTMKIFHAERRATGSNFRVESNIGCFFDPG